MNELRRIRSLGSEYLFEPSANSSQTQHPREIPKQDLKKGWAEGQARGGFSEGRVFKHHHLTPAITILYST